MTRSFSSAFLDFVYNTSAWVVIPAFVVGALVVSAIGLMAADALTSRERRNRHGELAAFIVTNIAVIYAVLLAFIAVATWETYSKATDLVETEANLAGDLYRDTTGLPGPIKAQIRAEVTTYLRYVVYVEWPAQQKAQPVHSGWRPLERIHVVVAGMEPATSGQTVLMQEMLRGVNAIYDARRSRLNAVDGHIPDLVWIVMVALGLITIAYGCFVECESFTVHLLMLAGLAVAISLVIALIIELDYPFRGRISVPPDAYESVLKAVASVK